MTTQKKKSPSKQQRAIMDFVRGHDVVDLDQILDFTMAASKASLQFTVRAMIEKGLIQKLGTQHRRGRSRQTFSLAPGGRLFYDPRTGLSTENVDKSKPLAGSYPHPVSDFVDNSEPVRSSYPQPISDFVNNSVPGIAHREISISDFSKTVPERSFPEVFLED